MRESGREASREAFTEVNTGIELRNESNFEVPTECGVNHPPPTAMLGTWR